MAITITRWESRSIHSRQACIERSGEPVRFAGRGQVIEEAAAPTAAASGTFSTRSLGCRILVTIDRTAPRGVKSCGRSNLGVVAAPLPMHGTTTLRPGLTDPAYCGWVHMSNARRARRFLIVATKTRSIRHPRRTVRARPASHGHVPQIRRRSHPYGAQTESDTPRSHSSPQLLT